MKNQDNGNFVATSVAVVTGAIVGAGVVAAGAMALKDKKNKEKIKEVVINTGKAVGKEIKKI